MSSEEYDRVVNLEGTEIKEIENLHIVEWHPLPDGRGQPTQVHFIIELKNDPIPFVMRFKRPGILDEFIAALQKHREGVWGPKLEGGDVK